MPIVFSSSGSSANATQVPWIDEYIFLAETGQLTPALKALGFKAYIARDSPLIHLSPREYLAVFRASIIQTRRFSNYAAESLIRKALKMSEPSPSVSITTPENTTTTRPVLTTRRSASMHKNLITKLRPLPFQYVWAVWYEKAATNSSSLFEDRLKLLAAQVPDIGAFYRIYNNFPWESVKLRDSVHVFRAGVKPLWEDKENLEGGSWTFKVRRDEGKAVKAWEEICLMACGGELQAAVSPERDHVLGISYSPRLYWAHIIVWTKHGSNKKSIDSLERTILERLSPEFRPAAKSDYYYKKHADHEGWQDAVTAAVVVTTNGESKDEGGADEKA